ncbi:MAG: DUF4175 family protein [Acidobacteriota bacterium]
MSRTLIQTISRVLRKLQVERLLKGAAILIAFFLFASLLSSYLLARHNFSDSALFWTRLVGLLGSLFLLGYYIFKPLWRAPSKRQVARFLEERHPELEERLSTAVEIEGSVSQVHPELRRLITHDARRQLAKISKPRLYYPQKSLASLLALFSSLLIFGFLFLRGPDVFPYSLNKIFRGWYDQSQSPLYLVVVTPGSVTVGKRADLEIRARLEGFDSEKVQLVARYENQPQWEETAMRPDPQGGDFVFIFFDIRDRIDYYVKADGIQSEIYTIEVSEIPRVESLKVVLQFPRYAGLPSVTLEDEGDIRALVGTEAEIFVHTDQPVHAGMIKLEKGGEVPLQVLGPQQLRGTLKITQDDYYRIHLQDQENFWNPASDEYLIEALQDQPPIVNFTRPGRDQRVTNIEEVFTQIKVEDDYGVARLALRFSVNGEPEQKAQLNYPKASRSFSTSHTFYLEEFDLEPGDFVSYYAEASDAVSFASTDIYFFEVEPFDREYYQSQQGAPMPGANARDNIMLSKRQKEIIAATFKLQRDRARYSASEFAENNQTLALVQQRLQSETQTIVDRIGRRGAAVADPRFQKMAQHLKQAVTHMEPAHQQLNQANTREALQEEQKSFQQLLRAEALFKEIQVSFAQNQGGGGASAEELADLVDLELDRTKNQYESLQQNRQLNREQALDEALEKLKELAQRQQQLAQRRRQQAMQGSSNANLSQQQLIEEAQRLARQLERLSRQQQDPQLQDISRQLRQAVRDMRRAQSSGQNNQEAQMRAQQALERLQEAQRALGQQRRQQLVNNLQQLKESSQRLVRDQKEMLNKIDDLDRTVKSGKIDQSFIQELRKLLGGKSQLQEDLHQLEGNLHQTARQMGSKQAEASRKLKEAALDVRDQRIPEKMQEGSELLSRGWTDLAREREEGVAQDLEELAEKIREAEAALGPGTQSTPREKLQRALNQIGTLVENLESFQDRASGANQEQRARQEKQGEPPEVGQEVPEQARQGNSQDSEQQGPGQSQFSEESQGAPRQGGGTESAGTYAGAVANTHGINPRQVRREWQERLRDAEQLRGFLDNRPELGRVLAGLIRRMRQVDAARVFTDAEEVARLKAQIVDGFRQLELEINRALEEEVEHLLRLVNEEEVPPEFRDRVEEYYRTLANKRTP